MLQEIFAGKLIGHPELLFNSLDASQKVAIAAIAAGFAGLLSLFNIGGRFFWASLSDYIGRKNTYYTFFILGIICYLLMPWSANAGSKAVFVGAVCIILSMYGGGFATVPAYLADMFGTQFVGAIHGRLLTAWSTAGIIGPVVVNYIREAQLAAGVPRAHLYDYTLYILAGMLVVGLICNLLDQAGRSEMVHEPGGRREAASRKRGWRRHVGRIRDRQRWPRLAGGRVLAVRRHSACLGRVDHAGIGGEDPAVSGSYRRNANGAAAQSRAVFCLPVSRTR